MKIPLFYYHSIGGIPPETLPVVWFANHLETIREQGFRTVTVSDLIQGRYREEERVAALIFDDGLLDNYENAVPLLNEFQCTATFFVVPGYDRITRWVNPKTARWSDVVMEGYTIPFKNMGAHHRRELLNMKMEIGSHSLTHRRLTRLDPREYRHEIIRSKQVLEDELGTSIKTFCYPNGKFNRGIVRIVREAGYIGACSTIPGYSISIHKGIPIK
uniref:Polysaccharide deacetylase n=1 Tax=Candidatus Kentrum sp. FW TaxID=2126338 RepID=A0A450SXR5_9GAMM|nr:MAG: Polysaccharide deacetylase [Candidatus Kentron sp. FW]VFJ58909.1 MAG: Polysaccharide deacetylase [Candidatus Kentron sp. FW]